MFCFVNIRLTLVAADVAADADNDDNDDDIDRVELKPRYSRCCGRLTTLTSSLLIQPGAR